MKDKITIAKYLYKKIWYIEKSGIYSENEIDELLKELEAVDDFPNMRRYLDFHYKHANTREMIAMSLSRLRSSIHKVLKEHNMNPLDKNLQLIEE